ncbi:ATP synthase E chain-domain-containing protein, partial [Paraphoma chrysanthemicola]
GKQVLRWSALGFGVFYGAYHQLSISARNKVNHEKQEWERKESLIRQAKAEWAKTHPSEQPKSSAKADPKDPNADLNTLLGITDN